MKHYVYIVLLLFLGIGCASTSTKPMVLSTVTQYQAPFLLVIQDADTLNYKYVPCADDNMIVEELILNKINDKNIEERVIGIWELNAANNIKLRKEAEYERH